MAEPFLPGMKWKMQTVAGNADLMHLDFTRDVMKIMTDIRKEWGMTYPEEE